MSMFDPNDPMGLAQLSPGDLDTLLQQALAESQQQQIKRRHAQADAFGSQPQMRHLTGKAGAIGALGHLFDTGSSIYNEYKGNQMQQGLDANTLLTAKLLIDGAKKRAEANAEPSLPSDMSGLTGYGG